MNQITEIPRAMLRPDHCNVRKTSFERAGNGLEQSIQRFGFIKPLIVRKQQTENERDYYSVLIGSRRWLAGMALGMKTFPCIIKELSDLEAKALSLQENINRKELEKNE